MPVPHLEPVLALHQLAHTFAFRLKAVFWSLGSEMSLASVTCAFVVGVAYLILRRAPGRRAVRLAVLRRALFPRRLVAGRSTRADLTIFFFNTFAATVLLAWAIVSHNTIGHAVRDGLSATFGARTASATPAPAAVAISTLTLFLAYETGYFLDHYLKHKVPFLWAFHKVHHTAEVLSPLTALRIHPVDSVIFLNILALFTGVAQGVLDYAFGHSVAPLSVQGANVILLLFLFSIVHLQHTHIWIAFTGRWGRLILSPAHHQIHHSANPAHFDRNFGSCLAVWDWMFGTLHIPSGRRERLTFGAEAVGDPHTVTAAFLTPFLEAGATLKPAPQPTLEATAQPELA